MPKSIASKAKKAILHTMNGEVPEAAVRRAIERFAPEVVQVFGTETALASTLPDSGIPWAIHIQGNLTVYRHKWFSGIDRVSLLSRSSLQYLLSGRGFVHDYIRIRDEALREQKMLKAAPNILGRTAWDRRIARVLAPGARYFHCDELIRSAFWEHSWVDRTPHPGPAIVLGVFHGAIYKGLETLLQATKLMIGQTRKPVLLRVAGLSEDSEIVQVVKKDRHLEGTLSAVTFLGSLSAESLAQEMMSADVFAYPSHIDNSPNSLCEAMLMGMPIISSNCGGIPSLLTDSVEGLLVQDGDPYSLAGAILELLSDPVKAKELAIRAQERARIRHKPKSVTDQLLSIYASISRSSFLPISPRS